MAVPDDNPLSQAKIDLGRRLFFEPKLSRDGTMACASCHDPRRAFTDGRATAIGIGGRRGTRNVPTLLNRGYGAAFFWDGRSPSLEDQVLEPIRGPRELGSDPAAVVARLARVSSYRKEFDVVFRRQINVEDLARALATFVRTIQSGDSPVDRYLDGEREALPAAARAGVVLFRGKANCWLCHTEPTFSDDRFHNTGVAWRTGSPSDLGRAAVTDREEDRGAFKTPTLREVDRTGPYMHDGSFGTLEEVVDYYDRGAQPNRGLDSRIHPLNLGVREKQQLVAFLKSLSGRVSEGK
jgi:cytochrome c peroxidase